MNGELPVSYEKWSDSMRMNEQELLKLLSAHEWKDIEFNEAQRVVPENSYESVSAFANKNIGYD